MGLKWQTIEDGLNTTFINLACACASTGRFVIICSNTAETDKLLYYRYSDDNGFTWTVPALISATAKNLTNLIKYGSFKFLNNQFILWAGRNYFTSDIVTAFWNSYTFTQGNASNTFQCFTSGLVQGVQSLIICLSASSGSNLTQSEIFYGTFSDFTYNAATQINLTGFSPTPAIVFIKSVICPSNNNIYFVNQNSFPDPLVLPSSSVAMRLSYSSSAWSVSNSLFPTVDQLIGYALEYDSNNFIFVGGHPSDQKGNVFYTIDSGTTFTKVETGYNFNNFFDIIFGNSLISLYATVLNLPFNFGAFYFSSSTVSTSIIINSLPTYRFILTQGPNSIVAVGATLSGVASLPGIAYSNGIDYAVCLLESCDILMHDFTYKNVKDIKVGDLIKSGVENSVDVKVTFIGKSVVCLKNLEKSNVPYLIKKDFFGKNKPDKDIEVSGHHRIIFKEKENTFVAVQAFKIFNLFPSEKSCETEIYYHIETAEEEKGMVVNNISVETLNKADRNLLI